ncbi:MAG TPA: DUF4197 domain-containing protein [Cyclobacteriaceae bacterium]|nr:DUF4197 domain-containing protein [Cyclobacteriaceae bacterium]
MKNLSQVLLILIFSSFFGCTASEINKILQGAGSAALTNEEVGQGLKEALIKGISEGAEEASSQDGFFKNELIRIALPEEFRQVENTMRQFGLGAQVDRVLLAINRGAENAAGEAKPIFIQAIRQLTIQDAFAILRGGDNAATNYLQKTTSEELTALFQPKIQESLDQVGALRHYKELVSTYNAIPGTKNLNPDLNAYVTEKALDGLFLLIAEEEKRIRENPLERTTALMRRVFAAQDL